MILRARRGGLSVLVTTRSKPVPQRVGDLVAVAHEPLSEHEHSAASIFKHVDQTLGGKAAKTSKGRHVGMGRPPGAAATPERTGDGRATPCSRTGSCCPRRR